MLAALTVIFLVFAGIFVFTVLAAIAIYNRLMRLRSEVDSSWSEIAGLLKNRYDIAANLIETVRDCTACEGAGLVKDLAGARTAALQASSGPDKIKAEYIFRERLKELLALAETCPGLAADSNFEKHRSQLDLLEDSIEKARTHYNLVVSDYNFTTGSFPSNLMAGRLRLAEGVFFGIKAPTA